MNLLFKLFLFLIFFALIFISLNSFYLSFRHKNEYEDPFQLNSKSLEINSIFFNYIFQNISVKSKINRNGCKLYNNVNNTKYSHEKSLNYPILLPLHQNKSINFKCLNHKISQNKRKKTILIYNDLIKLNYLFKNDIDYDKKEKCPIGNCLISTNKSLMSSSDLVIFNLNDKDSIKLPKRIHLSQFWAYFLFEPFDQTNFKSKNLDLFNWSSTYMSDSTFFSFYYRNLNMVWNDNINGSYSFKQSVMKKAKIATIINECSHYRDHLIYLNELKKYIQVDVYGKCGKFNDCQEDSINNYSNDKCLEYLSKNYKYYFSFENNVCDNYVTDQFFDILKYDLVPIIFKSFDHDNYVPNNAFINANQYSTAKSLADYILYLESNLTAYLNHFKWKKYVEFRDNKKYLNGLHSILCDMCIKLNLNDFDQLEIANNIRKSQSEKLEYDFRKSCYHLNSKTVLGFYYSDPFREKNFIDDLFDFLLH
jgi:alpha-1,3-fucosyltransferase